MASLFNQTNINTGRYFFATQLDGEQQLFTSNTGVAPAESTYIGITGSGGNQVLVSQMPTFEGTNWVSGGDAVFAGTNSSYLTLSTIATNSAGASISIDRFAGSGVTCIENYGTNGSLRGFEFLTRGVNSELISTNSVGINNYISSIGRLGATAVLGASGTLLTSGIQASGLTSLDNPTGVGGRSCFGIQDLSGAVPYARWAMGTSTVPTGSNAGSDFTIYNYNDNGFFLNSPLIIRRQDSGTFIRNISSIEIYNPVQGVPVFPATKFNTEFGQGTGVPIAGASNQATPYVVLFSTPVSGLNPNTQSLLNINFINSLSSGSDSVNFKVGFSTATAYTNILQTSYVPGLAGSWTPSDIPGATTPIGATNICAMLDSDGLNPDGTGFLYVAGQLANPNAPADLIYCKKGSVSEATRNALVVRPV